MASTRAQQIRQKRLQERGAIDEKERQKMEEIEREARALFEWVLDMLENPTPYNTADRVVLYNTYSLKIQVGDNKEVTDKRYDSLVMERLAKMFEEEPGYTGDYWIDQFPERWGRVIITIE